MVRLYGIPNCDTVKKARTWLDKHGIEHEFCNVREKPLTQKQVKRWITDLGIDKVVNKRSTSWKQLSEKQRGNLDAASAVALICDNPTLFKRPMLELDNTHHAGFSDKDYLALFS